jgi:uncharacterized protein YgiM (DUF1202 family)
MYYTAEVIRYLTTMINDPRSIDFGIDKLYSIALWQIVEEGYQKITLNVQQEFISLTGRDDGYEEELESGITTLNDGNLSVNIRSSANSKSSIIGRLEPGMRALVLEKNEASDWIHINLKGIVTWVFLKPLN